MNRLELLLAYHAAFNMQPQYFSSWEDGGGNVHERTEFHDGWNYYHERIVGDFAHLRSWGLELSDIERHFLMDFLEDGKISISRVGDNVNIVLNTRGMFQAMESQILPHVDLPLVAYLWKIYKADGVAAYCHVMSNKEPLPRFKTTNFTMAVRRIKEELKRNF